MLFQLILYVNFVLILDCSEGICDFRASKQFKMCFRDWGSSGEEDDDKDSDIEDISSEEDERNVDDDTDSGSGSSDREDEDDVSDPKDKSPSDIEPEQGTSRSSDRNDNNQDVPPPPLTATSTSTSSKGQVMLKGVQLFPREKRKSTSFAKLARKYFSIQGTSTAAERAMSNMGNDLTKKRLRMKQDLFNALMYLSILLLLKCFFIGFIFHYLISLCR